MEPPSRLTEGVIAHRGLNAPDLLSRVIARGGWWVQLVPPETTVGELLVDVGAVVVVVGAAVVAVVDEPVEDLPDEDEVAALVLLEVDLAEPEPVLEEETAVAEAEPPGIS